MKNLILLLELVVVFSLLEGNVQAQKVTQITSTGRTTGHIATLTVTNPGSQPQFFKLGMGIIPSKEFETEEGIFKSQPQIHTGNIEREIAPGETAEIPVEGYCLDVGKPPLPAGESFPPTDEWVMAVPTSPEPVNPIGTGSGGDKPKNAVPTAPEPVNPTTPRPVILDDLPPSFKPVTHEKGAPMPPDELNPGGVWPSTDDTADSLKPPDKGVPLVPDELNPGSGTGGGRAHYLLIPGTDHPFNYTIDISEHPEDAARIIFPLVENITVTYDSLQQNGDIQTPFSTNESRQRDAVIQQSMWMATSLLQGQQYGKEEFTGRMEAQFEEASGTKLEEAPEEQQEQFNQGIDQFWGTFELVGEKAKVIKPVPKFEDEIQKSGDCPCNVCEVAESLKFFNYETGEEMVGDTIPWGLCNLKIIPPVFRSNCPDGCLPRNSYQLFIVDLDRSYSLGHPNQTYYYYGKNNQDPGQVIFKFRYRCWCDGQPCAEIREIQQELYFSETNDCCDRLRSPVDGALTFLLGNAQFVKMHRNRLKIRVNNDSEWVEEEFLFDIDIQSVFCNLEDDRVIGIVDREMQSQLSGNGTNEFNDASSLGFAGPANDVEGRDPSYNFRFMKSVMINGEMTEVQVAISVDKATCEFMVSVLFGNEVYENLSDPIYSASAILQQIANLQNSFSSYFWNRLLFLFTETLKHENNSSVMQALLNKIRNGIEDLKNTDRITSEEHQLLLNRLDSGDPLSISGVLGEIAGML